jgi:CRP/FNR family transcriptional regulator
MTHGERPAVAPAWPRETGRNGVSRSGSPEWDDFLAAAKRRRFPSRHILYRQGEPAETLFAVRAGLVKLISHSPDGRARIVRLNGPGALLGFSGLLDRVYAHTAMAVAEVETGCIAAGAVTRLKRDHPELYCRLLESGYGDLKNADRWITEFSTGSIKARVARLVNFLATLQSGTAQEVELLTCEEMAAVLGVTVESVSRILAEFKRGRLLRAVGAAPARLYAYDARALQRVARG